MMLGKILYGALFVVVLPSLLIVWAAAAGPNVSLPTYRSPPLGYAITASGLVLMFAAMLQLRRLGGGLPMNAFPRRNWFLAEYFAGFLILSIPASWRCAWVFR